MPNFNPGDRVALIIGAEAMNIVNDEGGAPFWEDYRVFFDETPERVGIYGTVMTICGPFAQVFWDEQYHDRMYPVHHLEDVEDYEERMLECDIPQERFSEPYQWNIDHVLLMPICGTAPQAVSDPILRRINKLYRNSKLDFVRAWAQ